MRHTRRLIATLVGVTFWTVVATTVAQAARLHDPTFIQARKPPQHLSPVERQAGRTPLSRSLGRSWPLPWSAWSPRCVTLVRAVSRRCCTPD
jgi:hypothetical protein